MNTVTTETTTCKECGEPATLKGLCRKHYDAKRKASRSGASLTYEERKQSGHPNVTFSLPQEVVDRIDTIGDAMGIPRSVVVAEAIKAFKKRTI